MSRPDEPVSPGGQEEAWFADDRWPVDRPDADPTRSARTPSAVPDPLTAHAPAPAEAPQWTKFGSTHSAEPSILPPTPPTADVPASAFAQPSGPSASPVPRPAEDSPMVTPEPSTVRLPPQPAPPASAPPAFSGPTPTLPLPAAYPPPYSGLPAYPGSGAAAYASYAPQPPYSVPPMYSAAPVGYIGYPPPTPPRRRTGAIVAIVSIAVVAALTAGIGAFVLVNQQEKHAPTAASTTPPSAGPTTLAPAPRIPTSSATCARCC